MGTLDDLPALARRHDVHSPALLFVGEVAALAAQLHWFGAEPVGALAETPSMEDNADHERAALAVAA